MTLDERINILDDRAKDLRAAKKAAAEHCAKYAAEAATGDPFDRRATEDRRDRWAERYDRIADLVRETERRSDRLLDRFYESGPNDGACDYCGKPLRTPDRDVCNDCGSARI